MTRRIAIRGKLSRRDEVSPAVLPLREAMRPLVPETRRSVGRLVRTVAIPWNYMGLRRSSMLLDPPVFVVGCGHSGTSLMIRILGRHSNMLAIPGETETFLNPTLGRVTRNLYRFNRLAAKSGKRRWVEKTPRHIRKIELILKYLPHAKIVIMVRDGRDVACSLKERTGDFDRGVSRWIDDNQAGMEFFAHSQVKVVRYEDLVIDKESQLREILSFLGEEYEEGMFNVDGDDWIPAEGVSAGRPNSEHLDRRAQQMRQPMYDGRGRWQRDMSDQERALFEARASGLMSRLGYSM